MSRPRNFKTVTSSCRVTVRGFDSDGESESYEIVPDEQADLLNNRIPEGNPLAQALIGAKVGDMVPFHPPSGDVELEVLDVSGS